MGPGSIAGVPFDSVRCFWATMLLRTTCMRLWGNWVASCVVVLQTKNKKKTIAVLEPFQFLDPLPTYKYMHFTTTFMCPRSIAGVPSSQALPGFLITAPPSVCVSDEIGALACGFQTKKKGAQFASPRWIWFFVGRARQFVGWAIFPALARFSGKTDWVSSVTPPWTHRQRLWICEECSLTELFHASAPRMSSPRISEADDLRTPEFNTR